MANKKTWPFKPLLGSQEAINNHPIKKGQFLIRKDGGAVYFDQDDETRILVADIGGGGGGGGDKSRYTIEKFTDNETGVVTFKLKQTLNDGTATYVGDVISLDGDGILVEYGDSVMILNQVIAAIEERLDANYNFTTFTELDIDTTGKTLLQITQALAAKNLPTNTIVTGQIYTQALPFVGANAEAEVMINRPAYWWTCTSLTNAPYSWNAIADSSKIIMDWTPTYNKAASGISYDGTASGSSADDVQEAIDDLYGLIGDVNDALEEVL